MVLVGWEAGEGSCPRLTNGCSGCTEPEQYFHSSVREKHWSNKRKHSHTHTDLSEMNPGIKKKKRATCILPFRVKNRRRLKEKNTFIQTDLRVGKTGGETLVCLLKFPDYSSHGNTLNTFKALIVLTFIGNKTVTRF